MGLSDTFSSPRARMFSTWNCLTHLHHKYDTNDNRERWELANIAWTCGDRIGGLHKVGFYLVFITTIGRC